MPQRSLAARLGWLLRDYAKRVWDNSGEDNVFFLAGGIAFNILLAAVPFFLLLATGLVYLLNQSPDTTSAEVLTIIDKFMPPHPPGDSGPAASILPEVIKRSGSLTIYSAIGFIWFSTRLFGSLRTVLAAIFDIDTDRGIIAGKIFDIEMTIVSSLLLVAYTALSAYLAIATSRGVSVLADVGLRKELMGLPLRHLPSGAGHDAMAVAALTDVAMLFVRCGNGGISHHPDETMTAADAQAAADVFTRFVESFVPQQAAA